MWAMLFDLRHETSQSSKHTLFCGPPPVILRFKTWALPLFEGEAESQPPGTHYMARTCCADWEMHHREDLAYMIWFGLIFSVNISYLSSIPCTWSYWGEVQHLWMCSTLSSWATMEQIASIIAGIGQRNYHVFPETNEVIISSGTVCQANGCFVHYPQLQSKNANS